MREREAIEKTYDAMMDVYEKIWVDVGEVQEAKEQVLFQKVRCGLSSGGFSVKSDGVARIVGSAKIFASPDLRIPAGCVIRLLQYGRETTFVSCGEAAVFPTHQEIVVQRLGDA